TPPPWGLRSVVTQSSVFMSQPSGTSRVNQPRASARTGMERRLVYDLPRARACDLALAHHHLAAHEHVADADGKESRLLEGRAVRDRVGVEDHEVGPIAGPH